MPRLTSFSRVCYPKAVMACHARRRSTLCVVQRRLCHATPDVIIPCVLSKGGYVMQRQTSFNRACFPKVMMTVHISRLLSMCHVQGQ